MPGNANPPFPPNIPVDPFNPGGSPQAPGQAPIALDDQFTLDEDSVLNGDLFADNGAGADSDPNGDSFTVTEVNGQATSVGAPILVTSADGRQAELTIQAGGTFLLDPLGNFNDLDAGEDDTVTFTYTISDGQYTDTANVTVTIQGVDEDYVLFDEPTPASGDTFGLSVSIDGNYVLIGAPGDDTSGQNVGQAYLFDASTGQLLQTFNDPIPTIADNFGYSVAINGNLVLIGAYGDDTNGADVGEAYLFDATTGQLLQTFDDPTPTGDDGFGWSVDINGNYVLIGAPLDYANGTAAGQAYLFDATGALLHTFDDPSPSTFDGFGYSVAIDGDLVLIGAPGDDTGGTQGAHLFDATTGQLLMTFATPLQSTGLGSSVAIDGDYVLIGAPGDDTNSTDVGQAYLFDATTGQLLQTFNDPTPTIADNFGSSVAIDGNYVLIGAWRDDTNPGGIDVGDLTGTNVGQAHLFDLTTGQLLQTFDDPTPTSADAFGSVAIDGNDVLIGAWGDDTNDTNVGQAYLFDASGVLA